MVKGILLQKINHRNFVSLLIPDKSLKWMGYRNVISTTDIKYIMEWSEHLLYREDH